MISAALTLAGVIGAMHVLKRSPKGSMLNRVYRVMGGGGPGADE
jgi:hypothetical protein